LVSIDTYPGGLRRRRFMGKKSEPKKKAADAMEAYL
jgi:hypothetical protein